MTKARKREIKYMGVVFFIAISDARFRSKKNISSYIQTIRSKFSLKNYISTNKIDCFVLLY